MTMTTKEKRLANTDIEISQHALVKFKFLTDLLLFVSSISVGRGKLQNERPTFIYDVLVCCSE